MAAKKRPAPKKPAKKASKQAFKKRSPKPVDVEAPVPAFHGEQGKPLHEADRPLSPPPVKMVVEFVPVAAARPSAWQRFKDWLLMVPSERA